MTTMRIGPFDFIWGWRKKRDEEKEDLLDELKKVNDTLEIKVEEIREHRERTLNGDNDWLRRLKECLENGNSE